MDRKEAKRIGKSLIKDMTVYWYPGDLCFPKPDRENNMKPDAKGIYSVEVIMEYLDKEVPVVYDFYNATWKIPQKDGSYLYSGVSAEWRYKTTEELVE